MAKNNKNDWSYWLFRGGLVAVLFAGIGALGFDFYLASTQWMLVSILSVTLAIYLRK